MTRALIIIAMIAASLIGSPAMASSHPEKAPERLVSSAQALEFRFVQRQISPREARSIALSQYPGSEYVSVRKSGDVYIVRIIARGGRVIDVIVDANTGRIR